MKKIEKVIFTDEERKKLISDLREYVKGNLAIKETLSCTFATMDIPPLISVHIIENFSELFNSYNFCHLRVYTDGISLKKTFSKFQLYTVLDQIRVGEGYAESDDNIKPKHFDKLILSINLEHSILSLDFKKNNNSLGLSFRMDF